MAHDHHKIHTRLPLSHSLSSRSLCSSLLTLTPHYLSFLPQAASPRSRSAADRLYICNLENLGTYTNLWLHTCPKPPTLSTMYARRCGVTYTYILRMTFLQKSFLTDRVAENEMSLGSAADVPGDSPVAHLPVNKKKHCLLNAGAFSEEKMFFRSYCDISVNSTVTY